MEPTWQKSTNIVLYLIALLLFVPRDTEGWPSLFSRKPSIAKDAKKISDHPWIEQISWHPRAYIYHNFLGDDECDRIIDLARPMMRQSAVIGQDGQSVLDQIRTSYGTFIRRKKHSFIQQIEERVASWTQLPYEHQEDLQILRYVDGQQYGAHYDGGSEKDNPRLCTVLLYLKTDNLEGGETAFPMAKEWIGSIEDRGPFSACADGVVATKPKKGDALLFYTLNPDGTQDPASMHTGCPVLKGSKWTATKWIHAAPFHPEWMNATAHEPQLKPEECDDENELCKTWAEAGECEKNPSYMKGTLGSGMGLCRRSCHACEACSPGDYECLNRNRVSQGFLPLDGSHT